MSKTSMNLIKTPSFVFDIDALIERVNGIKSLLVHGEKLCYAIKANPFLVNDLKDVVDCFEICSTGESFALQCAQVYRTKKWCCPASTRRRAI